MRALPTSAAVLAALGALGAAQVARAQDPIDRFAVTTRASGVKFDRSASMKNTLLIGVDAVYGLNRFFGVGVTMNVGRPNTRPEDFFTTLTFGTAAVGDTTIFLEAGQPVSLLEGGLIAMARFPVDRITPFVFGGGGYYGLFMDPQINRATRRMAAFSANAGGGVAVRLTDRAGIQIDVRDLILLNFRADKLDPTNSQFPNVVFVEDFPAPPERKKTVHNVLLSIGFRYVPSLRTAPATGEPPTTTGGDR